MADRATGVVLLLLVVRRQIGRDDLPALPLVGGAVHHLGRVVDDVRVVRRDADRRVPLEAVLEIARRLTELQLRVGDDLAAVAAVEVGARDRTAVAAGEDDVRVVAGSWRCGRSRSRRRSTSPAADGSRRRSRGSGSRSCCCPAADRRRGRATGCRRRRGTSRPSAGSSARTRTCRRRRRRWRRRRWS